MRSLHAVMSLWIACASACAESQSPPAPSKPAKAVAPVRAEPELVDFGFVAPHTALRAEVSLVNDTAQPLTIEKAIPSCQCTTVDLDGKVIPARGKLSFPLTMKVSSTGVKLANLQIAVGGLDSIIRVELRAEVVYGIRAVTQNQPGGPMDPFIDAATNPTRVRGEVILESLDGKPFRVLSIGMKPPQFVGWDPSLPPQSSYRARYDVSAKDCASMPRYLIVETDREDAPLIDMRVRHSCTHIRPKISFAEFRANAGVMTPLAPGTFEIEIKKAQTATGPAKVLAVTSTRSDMVAELLDQKSDRENTVVTVKLTPREGASGVMLFPVRFDVTVPGLGPLSEELLVYCRVNGR